MPPEIDTEAPPTDPPAAPPKDYVTRADLEGERALLRDVIGRTVSESVRALRQPAPDATPPPAREPEVDEDALATAIAEGGRGAVAAARTLARIEAERATNTLRREAVDPLANEGVASLAALTRDAAIAKMPLYKKYQGEVDAALEQLKQANPRAMTNLDTVMGVYRYIVGMHAEEREVEVREEAIRQAREPAAPPPAPTGRELLNRRMETPEDYFGDNAIAALGELRNGRGVDYDQFAQSMGYDDGDAYLKMAKEQPWGPSGLRFTVMPGPRGNVLAPMPARGAAPPKKESKAA